MSPQQTKKGNSRVQAAKAGQNQRLKMYLVVGVILVVGIAVIVAIGAKGKSSNGTESIPPLNAAQTAQLLAKVTSVPLSVSEKVGAGNVLAKPLKTPAGQKPLTLDGKPEMLYMGAEYCPYCATERWAMAVALSRFGTLTGVGSMHSSTSDVDPGTRTLTFHGSKFTSQYLAFVPVETETNIPTGTPGVYTPLDTPTAAEQALEQSLDTAGSIPFIDFGNQYVIAGATWDVSLLQGKSWDQIASALHDPNSAIAKGALGAANAIDGAICRITKNKPANVCNSPAIKAAAASLG